ncbi:hypothetical protein [Roseisolibacter agri]|uniref:Lipoprotein n=1 Tax=Roseisolibacter agri TaxID=2014610 RepID=A0AA37Q094_9BACT|nr:hypothetical protein [Roseisolibacter agri]GLC24275.1 hypothetical protein rosag_07880 [Roseisolibacter agri]
MSEPRRSHSLPAETSRIARPLTAALACLAVASCDGAARAFGPSPAAARAHVEDFFGGLGVRFVDVQRNAKFTTARGKLARHALSPSKVWGDTSVWTGQAASTRTLQLEGSSDGRRYTFRAASDVPAPDKPGDARHVMRLARMGGDGEWQWNTAVEHAVGRARAGDVASAMTLGIAQLARPQADLRPVLRTGLPRTAAALGRLLTLEEARSTPLADGSRVVDIRARFETGRLKATMPAFAAYVEKWVHPSKMAFALTDARGSARWLELRLRDDVLTVRLRTRADGALLALDGPARPMPDTVQLRTDARIHYMVFDVGMDQLVGEMTAVRGAHERGWNVRWRRAPEWHIPLGVRHLMSGTLNRPFEAEGMLLRLALRDSDAGQTLLVRRFDVAVKESAIVRWFGALGSRAMDDFSGRAEVEENRFLAELLFAMRADLGATLTGAAATATAEP